MNSFCVEFFDSQKNLRNLYFFKLSKVFQKLKRFILYNHAGINNTCQISFKYLYITI